MSANSRLTVAVHVLLWMELHRRQGEELATSERIAGSVNTNPVVIRRLLAELRAAGLVESRRGAGAGWMLTCDPDSVTLRDIHAAVEPGTLFALHRSPPNPACPVGCGISPTLQGIYGRVEDAVREELARVTLADVLRDALAAGTAE